MPRLKAEMADEHSALAHRGMEVEHKLLDRLEAEADDIPARDLPGAIRNVGVGAGIHTDKARDLRGDPSMVVRRETRSVEELIHLIQTKFPGLLPQGPVDAQVLAEVAEELGPGDEDDGQDPARH